MTEPILLYRYQYQVGFIYTILAKIFCRHEFA